MIEICNPAMLRHSAHALRANDIEIFSARKNCSSKGAPVNATTSNLFRLSAAISAAALALSLTGCTLGPVTGSASTTDTVASAFGGKIHGGPNPVVGARVVIYATTSSGYGTGAELQEATANYPASSPVTHQDTDANGNFSFAGSFTCPAGQFAYIVAYGGNAGGGNNPNSLFAVPLGSCDTLYTGTTYNGSSVWIDELTTVATAYALNNFISVTGNAVGGYTVGIGAPATNNGGVQPSGSATASNGVTTGCVVNSYYNPVAAPNNCVTTSAAGLRHAFTNALALVSTTTGAAKATTPSGALVPATELNTLGNIMQACVNSAGGGTDATTGLPNTTTTASGTSHDGTACGKLFAFTSYTNNGTASGTLTAAGNTLSAFINLVKRPMGSASTFDSACDSNSGTGATTAVACIFNLSAPIAFYQPSMSVAPNDYMIGIAYAKGAFSTSSTNTFATQTSPVCAATTTNNGLFYPTFVQTDINDNVLILNGDASTAVCGDIIEIGSDGTFISNSGVDNTDAAVTSIALDAWGHVLLPLFGSTGLRFYQYGANGLSDTNDSSMPILLTATNTNVANKGQYASVDSNGKIYVGSHNTTSNWGYFAPTTLSHTAPVYSAGTTVGTTTSQIFSANIDLFNNAIAAKGSSNLLGSSTSDTGYTSSPMGSGAPNGNESSSIALDTSLNAWEVGTNGTTSGTSQTVILKNPYTYTSTGFTWGSTSQALVTAPAYSYPATTNVAGASALAAGVKNAVMDGNNVMWFPDLSGSSTATPAFSGYLRGYDTVNNYGTLQLQGCKFNTSTGYTITAWNIGASSTTFTTTGSEPVVGSVVTLSNFGASTFFNGVAVTLTAIGTGSFTVANTFGQSASTGTETGTATTRAGTTCGTNAGDGNFPSTTPFLLYQTRGIAVDSMGDLWFPNGTQGTVTEVLGIAAPTLPNYIHNGLSQKP